jgi:hypothetical protein
MRLGGFEGFDPEKGHSGTAAIGKRDVSIADSAFGWRSWCNLDGLPGVGADGRAIYRV